MIFKLFQGTKGKRKQQDHKAKRLDKQPMPTTRHEREKEENVQGKSVVIKSAFHSRNWGYLSACRDQECTLSTSPPRRTGSPSPLTPRHASMFAQKKKPVQGKKPKKSTLATFIKSLHTTRPGYPRPFPLRRHHHGAPKILVGVHCDVENPHEQ